jgi:DNA replication protein DnaC
MPHVKELLQNLAADAEFNGSQDERPQEDEHALVDDVLEQKYDRLFGPRFAHHDIDQFMVYDDRQRQVKDIVQRYINLFASLRHKRKNSLILAGKSGTGKTHLAYAIARHAIKNRYEVEVVTFMQIMREIKTAWSFHNEKEQDVIDRYARCDFLLLEEIGVQYDSQTEKIFLFEILDLRYKRSLPTVITTNLDSDGFKRHIDFDGLGRLWDRLQDNSVLLMFDWPSWREKTDDERTQIMEVERH